MKEVIVIMDEDTSYSKKFCNQAIKLLGKKYIFLTFKDLDSLKEYSNNNQIECLLVSNTLRAFIDDIKVNHIYILNEDEKKVRREGKRVYIYKLQSIIAILGIIDEDILSNKKTSKESGGRLAQVIVIYSAEYIKDREEITERILKLFAKKKKVLMIDVGELNNYKGNVGLSNVIFDYKENNITKENLQKEILTEKEYDKMYSVTYPEDFNVVSNIDLANILCECRKLDYDYIFVNADPSLIKIQYVLNDADSIILYKNNKDMGNNKLVKYFKTEKVIDIKKITEIDISKIDRVYLNTLVKGFMEKYED